MMDIEVQEILSTILWALRTQAINSRKTYDVLTALLNATEQTSPELYSLYKKEMERQQISSDPLQQHIRTIDEAIERLNEMRRDTLLGPRLPGF